MSGNACRHPDVRKFDGLRCCLACGEAVFDAPTTTPSITSVSSVPIPYEYANLNYLLGQEIRLCVLLPGELADSLQCEIVHVNLEDRPDYEAVSYTWATEDGDASLSRSIHCGNNRYLSITANCDAVLRRLRKRGLRRRLWVDAVSINQKNINERNHQVGLMDHVYSQARSVRICIQEIYIAQEQVDYKKMFGLLQRGSQTEIAMNADWLFSSLTQLSSLQYFSRAWVIQEVALATTAYLQVNGEELLLTSEVMDQLDALARRNNYQLPGVLRLRWKANQLALADIVACLHAGLDSECTDPRDKIFAVLSFINPQARALIPVDYSLDVAPIYASAVLAVISSRCNLEVLSHVGWNEIALATDWRTSPALTTDQFRKFLAHEEAGESAHPGLPLGIASELATMLPIKQFHRETFGPWRANVKIRTVDELDIIPEVVNKDTSVPVTFCRRPHNPFNILPWFQVRAHFIDRITQTHAHLRASGFFTRKPHTHLYAMENMRLDQAYQQFQDYAWLLPYFQTTLSSPHPYLPDQRVHQDGTAVVNAADLVRFVETAVNQGARKDIFSTTNSVGFARPGFKSGDEVWAIDGARAPFILRSVRAKTYRIVSDCYLWAALELDYWNPGTKKGRWRPERTVPEEEQTHIIEIY